MKIRDHMSTPPITVHPETGIFKVFNLMKTHHVHHVPVVDAKNKLVGILAERDLLLSVTRFGFADSDVADTMRREVLTTTPDAPLVAAAEEMLTHRVGGLPVVDENRAVVGIITETDLLRTFVEMANREMPSLPA